MNRRLSEEELFKRLKSNDVSIIYSALANIASYYGRNCEAMKVLEKYSAIENIISYLEHPKLSSFSVSIIADACLESSLVQEIIKNNAVTVLIRIMKSTVTDQIRSRACRALGNIALSELGFTSIPGQEIVPILVRFLTETVDVNHQQIALRTLRILGKSSKNRVIIVREKALTSIVGLLHSSHKKVLLSSIKTLSELSANCNKELGNQLIDLEVHTILVELYSQAESPAQKCALTTLKNMSYCHEIKNILVKAGVLNTFVKAANNHQDFEISSIAILALCKFLDRVFAFNIEEKNAILKVLIEVLQLNTYKTIHAHIISALFPLSFTPKMTEVLRDYKIVTVLICLLKYFISYSKFKHINREPTTYVDKFDNFSSVIDDASSFSNIKEGFKKLPSSFPSVLGNIPNPEGNAESLKESHFRADKSPVAGKSLNRKSESNVVSLKDNSEFFDKSRTEYSGLSAYDEFAKSDQISSLKLSDSLEQLGKHNIAEENCKLSMLNAECIISSAHEKKRKAEHLKDSASELSVYVINGEYKRIKTSKESSVVEEKEKISKTEHLQKADVSDHHILRFLLQIASHSEIKACLDFTNKTNFIVLLDYIYLIPNPDSKALKCLLKVAENVNCFEKLIVNGFFMAIEENFKKMHDFNICYHCSQVNAIYKRIYLSACTVAESNYGIGILHKLLSSPEKQNQLNALHTISRIVKNMPSGLKLLIL
ncbi:Armadillo repeat-containing protein 5, partial [Stegodyphus mimosarum]